jgi:hypothetical protein
MLPPGASADLAEMGDQQVLKSVLPEAQTVAHLLVGRCSCDFVRGRQQETREDERHLRERYRRLDTPRSQTILSLERHRRGGGIRSPREGWPRALARFVAEHCRNAGPSLYHLHFSPGPPSLGPLGSIREVSLPEVIARPEHWLQEDAPALVSR